MHFQLWLHGGNVKNPFPLGQTAKRKRIWLIGGTIPRCRVLCVYGSRVKWWVCVSHERAQGESLHIATPLAKSIHASLNLNVSLRWRVEDREVNLKPVENTTGQFQCRQVKLLFFHEWKNNRRMLNLHMNLPKWKKSDPQLSVHYFSCPTLMHRARSSAIQQQI